MTKVLLLALTILSSSLGLALPSTSQGTEPLFIRSQSMGQFFRFDPLPIGTKKLLPGEIQIVAAHTTANQWGYEKRYIIDGQTQDDVVELRTGLKGGWLMGMGFGSRRLNPSFTDNLTIGFHNLFAIPQGKRLSAPKDQTYMTVPDYGVEMTQDDHGKSWTDHYYLRLNQRFLQIGPHIVGGGLLYARELAKTSLMGRGAASYALQVQASSDFASLHTLASFAWTQHQAQHNAAHWLQSKTLSSLLAAVYDLSNWQLISQLLIQSGSAHHLGQYSRNSFELQLGARRNWQEFSLEFAIIENLVWHFNTPDWGFTFGLSYRTAALERK